MTTETDELLAEVDAYLALRRRITGGQQCVHTYSWSPSRWRRYSQFASSLTSRASYWLGGLVLALCEAVTGKRHP